MRKRPILMKGERLITPVVKKNPFIPKELPKKYEEAKKIISNSLDIIKNEVLGDTENFLPNEMIVCAKMEEGYLAKSYRPDFLEKNHMELVGARKITKEKNGSKHENKIYFYRTSIEGIDKFKETLEKDLLGKTASSSLCRIENVEMLDGKEKAFGFFEEDYKNEVEIVLHPLKEDYDSAIKRIEKYAEIIQIKKYNKGPTFILASLKNNSVDNLVSYNFLRTIHPMRTIDLIDVTRKSSMDAPIINDVKILNKIKVGVFDGGVSLKNSLLKNFVVAHDVSSLPPTIDGVSHGSAVCGASLYGPLNNYNASEIIDSPKFIVESFRVLPEKNIYMIIDNIEKIVKLRKDIKIYNISFGPRGPIWDDEINCFTYALDRLAYDEEVLFCVAVGNDGDLSEPFNRIQAPSDLVNGLGIGAYSYDSNNKYRANYSCVGLGREGAKIKPDVLAFGGDTKTPFQATGVDDGARITTCGTSFASPVVAGKLAEILNDSDKISPLVAKTLFIHNTQEETGIENLDRISLNNMEEILNCTEKKVTIIYTGEITGKSYTKLPITLPDTIKGIKGIAQIEWTISILSDINSLDPDGYTLNCIKDVFYPNSNKYKFTKSGEKDVILNLECDYDEAIALVSNGYKQADFPITDSPKYATEEERRENLQWDTIVKKHVSKKITSLDKPYLVMHCIPRETKSSKKVKFCVCVTVECKKYTGDLYNEILNEYPVLVPLESTIDIEVATEVEV